MDLLFITNPRGQRIAVYPKISVPSKGVVFLMHGLGYTHEELGVGAVTNCFKQAGYTTILFDSRCSFGASDGSFEDVTITSSYEDLCTVISWAKNQPWYKEPFFLSGHSVGGFCSLLFA